MDDTHVRCIMKQAWVSARGINGFAPQDQLVGKLQLLDYEREFCRRKCEGMGHGSVTASKGEIQQARPRSGMLSAPH